MPERPCEPALGQPEAAPSPIVCAAPAPAPRSVLAATGAPAASTPITDADVVAVVDALHRRGTVALLARIDAGLANGFPHANDSQRCLAMQDALHRRALVITPMGDIRRPPLDED